MPVSGTKRGGGNGRISDTAGCDVTDGLIGTGGGVSSMTSSSLDEGLYGLLSALGYDTDNGRLAGTCCINKH